jgi:hypothetical protein
MCAKASEIKGLAYEAEHFHPLSAEVKNNLSFTSAVMRNAAFAISLHACFTCKVVPLGSRPNSL